jgi:hypothetical protein
MVADSGGTKEDAQAAFDQADNNRKQEEQKAQNNRMYAEKRLDKKELAQQLELMYPTEIQTMFKNVAITIGTIRDDRRKLEEAKKAKQARILAVQKDGEKQVEIRESSKKRKAAAPSKKAAGRKSGVDYLDDSEEAFEEWYSALQDKL